VYAQHPRDIRDLRDTTAAACEQITPQMLDKTWKHLTADIACVLNVKEAMLRRIKFLFFFINSRVSCAFAEIFDKIQSVFPVL
jgi:hypothetical protein